MPKTTLEIRDEVNVKFVGLDVKTRRKIRDVIKYLRITYCIPPHTS